MNRREFVWSVSHDIIEAFSKDFGIFKGTALDIAYKASQQKTDAEIDTMVEIVKARVAALEDKNAKKKE